MKKEYIFQVKAKKTHISISHFFAVGLLDKLKIESPKSNGCYFDDLILKFEHVKPIIRPIEILLDGFFFTPLLACLRSVVKRERLFLSSFNLILWSVCWHGLAASHWWPRSLD